MWNRKKGYFIAMCVSTNRVCVCACGCLKVEEFKKIQYQQDKVDGHLVIIDGMT